MSNTIIIDPIFGYSQTPDYSVPFINPFVTKSASNSDSYVGSIGSFMTIWRGAGSNVVHNFSGNKQDGVFFKKSDTNEYNGVNFWGTPIIFEFLYKIAGNGLSDPLMKTSVNFMTDWNFNTAGIISSVPTQKAIGIVTKGNQLYLALNSGTGGYVESSAIQTMADNVYYKIRIEYLGGVSVSTNPSNRKLNIYVNDVQKTQLTNGPIGDVYPYTSGLTHCTWHDNPSADPSIYYNSIIKNLVVKTTI